MDTDDVAQAVADLRAQLRDLRGRSGLSVEQLRAKTGLSRTTISHALNDGRNAPNPKPSWSTVHTLAAALRASPEVITALRSRMERIEQPAGPATAPRSVSGAVTLPSTPDAFAGRTAELEEILQRLDPSSSQVQASVVVAGMAGVGKTALVLQAAHEASIRQWFQGGALFADFYGYSPASELDADAAIDQFLRALGFVATPWPATPGERRDAWRQLLNGLTAQGLPVLLVLDNVHTAGQVKDVLPTTPHRAVITSRHALSALPARRQDLGLLTREEAVDVIDAALLADGTGDNRATAQRADAERIAELCGYLPLALRIVAALLRDEANRPLADLADELSDTRTRLDAMTYDDLAVRASLQMSYQRLNHMQRRVFRLLEAAPGTDISTSSACALLNQRDTRRVLTDLARAHLLEHFGERWRMHDLVRLFARDVGERYGKVDAREAAVSRLLDHYLITTHAAATHFKPWLGPVSEAFPDLGQALAWLDAERHNLLKTVEIAAAQRHRAAGGLAFALADYLGLRRQYGDSLHLWTRMAVVFRETGDRQHEAMALDNRGVALFGLGRFDEALITFADAGNAFREAGDQHGVGMALNHRGEVLGRLHRVNEALAAHTEAASIFHETGDQHREAIALSGRGNVLRALRRFDEALTAQIKAADTFDMLGDRHSKAVASTIAGFALWEAGRFDEAIVAQREAADAHRELGDRHGEVSALSNLSLNLQGVGRFDEAIATQCEAADISREIGDRTGEARTLSNLGLLLGGVGRLDESSTAFRTAANICRELGEREGEAIALNNLGLNLQRVGDFDEAFTAHDQAADILRETGDRHGQAGTLVNLGDVLSATGHLAAAVTVQNVAAAIFRELGDRHHELTVLDALGLNLQGMRRFEDAVTVHNDAVGIASELGDRYEESTARGNLGMALGRLGRFDEAIVAQTEAAAAFRDLGCRHEEAAVLNNVGCDLRGAGRFDDAIAAHTEAARICRELGDSRREAMALNNARLAREQAARPDQ